MHVLIMSMHVYACSDTDLGKVLFHKVMLGDKGNGDLSSKIYHKHMHLCPFLVLVKRKSSLDQI